MTQGEQIVILAESHIGEVYKLGANNAPLDNPNFKGPWDCAEFATWCVYQISKISVGHRTGINAGGAFTGYWQADIAKKCTVISKKQAKNTPGAILLKFPDNQGNGGHIAFSDGSGGTVEARNAKSGVTRGKVNFRGWDVFVLVNGVTY